MKSISLLLLVCLLAGSAAISQPKRDTLQNPLNKAYYQKISQTQKTQATLLVIGGGAGIVVGGLIWYISPISGIAGTAEDVNRTKLTGITVMAIGAGLTALSIPLFNASKENQKKAELYIGSGPLYYPLTISKEMLCMGVKIPLH